jgi:hypothetical protein
MEDIVVVGGLVPSLLIDQGELPDGAEPHVGTTDLDIGLTLSLFEEARYREISERLRRAQFEPDVNQGGRPTNQRWVDTVGGKVTIDFLIPPSRPGDEGGQLRNLEHDFAALITPGLDLAFRDRQRSTLAEKTSAGEPAVREVWICGAGAYIVLKALATERRGEDKDAYDLYYVIRNFGSGPADVADRLRPFAGDENCDAAVEILRRDFAEIDAIGPRRVAAFLTNGPDEYIQADVVGFVAALLQAIDV